MTGKQLTHYPKDHLKEDGLDDIREPLSRALDLSSEDFDRMSPEVKNLLSGRRNPRGDMARRL